MKNARAFTLIELLIVATITVILCGIAIPYFVTPDEHFLQYELDKISVLLLYLQQRAIASHETQALHFLPSQNSYGYDRNQQHVTFALHADLQFGAHPNALGPPGDPKNPITAPSTFPQHTDGSFYAKLFPNGKISAGTLYLKSKRSAIMGALTCTVSQVSYIRRYLYQAGQWHLCQTSIC